MDVLHQQKDLILWLIALLALIILSAFFSISETGMMAINRYRLRHQARKGYRGALRIQKLLERPDRLLGVILIGSTFTNILASSIATYIAVRLFGDIGILVATVILTLIILIFAEIAPKTVAVLYAQRVALIVSLPLRLLLIIIYPIVWLANLTANGFLFLFGIRVKGKHVMERLSQEELKTVVHESIDTEHVSAGHKNMLLGILDLAHITVEDAMRPRNEIIGIDLNMSWENILQAMLAGPTRFLVYQDNIDKVAGILYLKDAAKLMSQNQLTRKTLMKTLHEPYFIPEGTSLQTQLHEFRQHQRKLAVVVDEYGDILGLITLNDILEEIVGELDSNLSSLHRFIHTEADGSYIIDGTVVIRELNKFLHWHLPVNGPKTISGLVMEWLETIPSGEVCLQSHGYRIEVLAIKDNRILKMKISKINEIF